MESKHFAVVLIAAFICAAAAGLFIPHTPVVQAQSTVNQYPSWTCSLDDIAATLTQCRFVPPDPTTRYYLYDVVAQSTTTTAGNFIIRTGTGANCGTATASLLPSAATAARLAAPANTVAALYLHFDPPLVAPLGHAICVLGVATNTFTGQLSGRVGP